MRSWRVKTLRRVTGPNDTWAHTLRSLTLIRTIIHEPMRYLHTADDGCRRGTEQGADRERAEAHGDAAPGRQARQCCDQRQAVQEHQDRGRRQSGQRALRAQAGLESGIGLGWGWVRFRVRVRARFGVRVRVIVTVRERSIPSTAMRN